MDETTKMNLSRNQSIRVEALNLAIRQKSGVLGTTDQEIVCCAAEFENYIASGNTSSEAPTS